jgi:hypothetical protein
MYRSPDPDDVDELADDDPDELAAAVDRLRVGWPGLPQRRPLPEREPKPCACHGIRVAAATPLELVDR